MQFNQYSDSLHPIEFSEYTSVTTNPTYEIEVLDKQKRVRDNHSLNKGENILFDYSVLKAQNPLISTDKTYLYLFTCRKLITIPEDISESEQIELISKFDDQEIVLRYRSPRFIVSSLFSKILRTKSVALSKLSNIFDNSVVIRTAFPTELL